MDLHPYFLPLVGGLLVGASATLLLVGANAIAGISGILGGLLDRAGDTAFRVSFLTGLIGTGSVLALVAPGVFGTTDASLGRVLAGGLLVGFGTRLGNGCTSGHGVCGISRLSPRSLLATVTFVGVAMITVAGFRVVAGGAP